MTTVQDILDFLQTIAPTYMKEEWDNVGLNCGRTDKPVQTVLLALDPFEAVCREARDVGADLLLSHHALLWQPGFITDQTQQGKNALFLIESGIACINAHTNLDCAPGGVNDTLAAALGLQNIQVVAPAGTDLEGNAYGLLRCGTVDPQPLENFLNTVKTKLGCKGLKYVPGSRPVHKVAVGGGACASFLQQAIDAGCDTFVTSDIKYNQFWDANDANIHLIDAGHFHTENPVIAVLAAKLSAAFPNLTVKISKTHDDCVKFY